MVVVPKTKSERTAASFAESRRVGTTGDLGAQGNGVPGEVVAVWGWVARTKIITPLHEKKLLTKLRKNAGTPGLCCCPGVVPRCWFIPSCFLENDAGLQAAGRRLAAKQLASTRSLARTVAVKGVEVAMRSTSFVIQIMAPGVSVPPTPTPR